MGVRLRGLIIVVAGSLVAALSAAPPHVPQQPDLRGTWVATKDAPSTVPAAPSAVFGERVGLDMDATTLTVTRVIRGASFVNRHPLDGTETRFALPSRQCMGDTIAVTSAAKTADGISYTVVSNIPAGGAPVASGLTYKFRLESPDTLVVETTMRTSAQSGPTPVGTVYRRSTDALPPPLPPPPAKGTPATIAQVGWISGEWEGAMGTSNVEERWTPAAGGAMLAISRTTRTAGTMSAFEFLCIAERAGSLVYVAMPNAGAPTDFVLTAVDADSATFENPAHSFPKVIRYAKRGADGMDATISGAPGSKPTTFSFTRRAPR
jgi:hypothetical protein